MARITTNPISQSSVAKQSTGVSVLTTSTVVAADNPGRSEITVVNDGANVVYLQLATQESKDEVPTAPTALLNQGIRLNASGGQWTSGAYTGPVAGIASVGATNCTVEEV